LMRASKRSEVATERRVLERGWRPLWLRAYLDLVSFRYERRVRRYGYSLLSP